MPDRHPKLMTGRNAALPDQSEAETLEVRPKAAEFGGETFRKLNKTYKVENVDRFRNAIRAGRAVLVGWSGDADAKSVNALDEADAEFEDNGTEDAAADAESGTADAEADADDASEEPADSADDANADVGDESGDATLDPYAFVDGHWNNVASEIRAGEADGHIAAVRAAENDRDGEPRNSIISALNEREAELEDG